MPKYTQSQLDALNRDRDFQIIVDRDRELTRLFALPKRGRNDRLAEIKLAFGGECMVSPSHALPAPTAGSVMLLAAMESPYLVPGKKLTLLDVDVAVYVLGLGADALVSIGDCEDIEREAAGICDKLGVDRMAADMAIDEALGHSLRAFELIPHRPGVGEPCKFDLQWLASFVSRVCQCSNVNAHEATWEMPLAMASHFAVARHEQNGGKVDRPSDSEAIMDRLHYLMDSRIAEIKYA